MCATKSSFYILYVVLKGSLIIYRGRSDIVITSMSTRP